MMVVLVAKSRRGSEMISLATAKSRRERSRRLHRGRVVVLCVGISSSEATWFSRDSLWRREIRKLNGVHSRRGIFANRKKFMRASKTQIT